MAMLAEPRQRKRYNLVPRGKALYEDDSRFGTKMLEKMGWEKGKGLGANEDGSKDFVRIRYKNDALGLGFEHRDDQWTQHEQSFNGLLKTLNNEEDDNADSSQVKEENGNDSEDEMPRVGFGFQDSSDKEKKKKQKVEKLKEKISGVSLEERSKQSKARVHYKKFTRGKDLAQYSEKDLANIFGKKVADDQEQAVNDLYQQLSNTFEKNLDSVKNSDEEVDEPIKGVQIINSGISVNDYFKTKMQALKKRQNTDNMKNDNAHTKDEQCEEDVTKKKKKKKKDKKDQDEQKIESKEAENETQLNNGLINSSVSVNDYFKMKMEALKNKNNSSNNEENAVESEVTQPEKISKKKKKREKKDMEQNQISETVSIKEDAETECEKKPKKHETDETLEIQEEVNTKKKKNKSKKRTFEEIEPQNEHVSEANAKSPITETEPSKKKQKKNKNTNEVTEIAIDTEIKAKSETESNKKNKKSKKQNKNASNEETLSTNVNKKNEQLPSTKTSKKAKRKDVSSSAIKALASDVNIQLLDLDELKKKYNDFNIYPLSSFCAEKFRNISLNEFTGSILPQIEGYGLGPELQLDVHVNKNDEERITNLWKGVLTKYSNLEKPKKTYQHYIRDVIKARKTKRREPKLYVKTWKRKNAFQII